MTQWNGAVSHAEQLGFFQAVASANRGLLAGGNVLEVGSYDVNGTVRGLFPDAARYVGVDLEEGSGVDRVAYGHQVTDPDGSFDVAVSGECFEHDPHWRETFTNMVRLTRPGGVVAFTCASRGRPEHGTRRTTREDSPGTQSVGLDYYRNLVEADFAELPLAEWFSDFRFWYLPSSFDLYFCGIRAGGTVGTGGTVATMPAPAEVERLRGLMPTAHRAARLPLALLARTGVREETFQRIALPYWQTLLRLLANRVAPRGA